MGIVCQTCGDKGISDALVTCIKCQDCAEHIYCSTEWPKNFDDDDDWICENCQLQTEQYIPVDLICSPSSRNELMHPTSVQMSDISVGIERSKKNTDTVADLEVQMDDSTAQQPHEVPLEVDLTKFVQTSVRSPLLENKHSSCCSMELDEFQESGQQRPIYEDGKSLEETAKEGKLVPFQGRTYDPSNISEHFEYLPAQPSSEPTWKGTFSICSDSFCTVMELAAHVSNKASLKVFEAARRFPTLLHLKVHPRLQLWPKSFCRSELTDGQIGLYFFPEGERDGRLFDSLLDDIIYRDLALVSVIDNLKLLVFTSLQLPQQCQRYLGKHYIWGVLKKCSTHNRSGEHQLIQCSNSVHVTASKKVYDENLGIKTNLLTVCEMGCPHIPLGNSDANAESNEFGSLAQSKEAFEQSPRGLSGEGVVEKETNLTSLDGSPESRAPTDCTHHEEEAVEEGVEAVKELKGIAETVDTGETASDTGTSQQELLSGYNNAVRNSETIISNEEINQAAENTSMNKNDSDETEVHTTDHRYVRKETDLNGEMEVETIDTINQNAAAILPKNVRAEKISEGVDQDKEVEGITSKFGSVTQSIESTFLRMANAFNEPTSDEASTADIGEKVGRYTVTPSLAPILKLIIERHGDIALNCTLSDRICCSILVEICETVKNLQAIPFAKIRVHHLNSLAAIIADAEHVNIRVDWLQDRHDELKETILMLNQYQSLKCSLQEKDEFITSTKEAIATKKAEIVKIQSDCQSLESQRDLMVLEIEKANGVINTVLSKYIFFNQNFLDGLR